MKQKPTEIWWREGQLVWENLVPYSSHAAYILGSTYQDDNCDCMAEQLWARVEGLA